MWTQVEQTHISKQLCLCYINLPWGRAKQRETIRAEDKELVVTDGGDPTNSCSATSEIGLGYCTGPALWMCIEDFSEIFFFYS